MSKRLLSITIPRSDAFHSPTSQTRCRNWHSECSNYTIGKYSTLERRSSVTGRLRRKLIILKDGCRKLRISRLREALLMLNGSHLFEMI